jgi:peptide methionine sulfoxide reductase MsrB
VTSLNIEGNCAVECNTDGCLELFVRGSDNHLWHLSQKRLNGDWIGWEDLLSKHKPIGDAITGNCAVGHAANGRLELFVRNSDNHLWHLWQDSPNGDWCDDCANLSESLEP